MCIRDSSRLDNKPEVFSMPGNQREAMKNWHEPFHEQCELLVAAAKLYIDKYSSRAEVVKFFNTELNRILTYEHAEFY